MRTIMRWLHRNRVQLGDVWTQPVERLTFREGQPGSPLSRAGQRYAERAGLPFINLPLVDPEDEMRDRELEQGA